MYPDLESHMKPQPLKNQMDIEKDIDSDVYVIAHIKESGISP